MKCQKCNEREATIKWVGEGSTMDFIHGNYQLWCEICSLKEQICHAEERAAQIPILKEKLLKLGGSL